MLKIIAKWYAKTRYRFNQLTEAETNLLHAKLADRLAKERRENATKIAKEADAMEARIKEVEEMEMRGYWLCEDGHERSRCDLSLCDEHENLMCAECKAVWNGDVNNPSRFAMTCESGEIMRLVERSKMSGQEKYESDKERGEAEDIAKQKREQATAQEDDAAESEKAAKYFRQLSQSNRSVAERLRRL
jgi:hypothetical protein